MTSTEPSRAQRWGLSWPGGQPPTWHAVLVRSLALYAVLLPVQLLFGRSLWDALVLSSIYVGGLALLQSLSLYGAARGRGYAAKRHRTSTPPNPETRPGPD